MMIIHDPFHQQKSIQIKLILTKHLHTYEVFILQSHIKKKNTKIKLVLDFNPII